MFRLIVCLALIVLCALVYSSEGKGHLVQFRKLTSGLRLYFPGTSDVSFIKCSTINCKQAEKNCSFGFRKDQNGCEICECHDPCKSLTEVIDHSIFNDQHRHVFFSLSSLGSCV